MNPADGQFPDALADDIASRIQAIAAVAMSDYRRMVGEGVTPAEAMRRAMDAFEASLYEILAGAFSSMTGSRWTVTMVRRYPVGRVSLSALVWRRRQETEAEVARIVAEHAAALHQARELALQLYEGYGFKAKDLLALARGRLSILPRTLRRLAQEPAVRQTIMQAARLAASRNLATAALRAAYVQAFDAALQGAAGPALDRLLRVAIEEKSRYFANRIAQTEMARTWNDAVTAELLADEQVEVVQIRLSGAHPRADICDVLATVDRYGLGPGCYPKHLAPKPPFHPFCRCRPRSRPDLRAADADLDQNAERAYLAGMDPREAARLVGSAQRLRSIERGSTALAAWNTGLKPAHRVPRMGQLKPGA